jgi:hypothetical protein
LQNDVAFLKILHTQKTYYIRVFFNVYISDKGSTLACVKVIAVKTAVVAAEPMAITFPSISNNHKETTRVHYYY